MNTELKHLTAQQKEDLLLEVAQKVTGLTVESKGNPLGADIDTWDLLKKSKKKGTNVLTPLNCRYNTAAILRQDPEYSTLSYNEHSDQVLLKGEMVSDVTIEQIALDMETRYRYRITDRALRASIIMVAQENKIEPIKDWLESLPEWDGQERLLYFFQDILKAKIPEGCEMLIQEMSVKWFVSCVARVMSPGCKMDTCLVLVGGKGMRKSTALKVLASEEYFSDSNINISHKDAYELLHQSGVWIWELAEMHALQGKTADNAKQFLTSAVDRYRPSYGKMPVERRRRTVFTASTNNYQFLSDGPERRFWCIEVLEKIDIDFIQQNRNQLWAEALHWYTEGMEWWLVEESDELNAKYQQSFIIDDPWTVKVLECLTVNNGKATTKEIMDYLDLGARDQHTGNSRRIGQILRDCGYEQYFDSTIKGRKWKKKGVK
jgi:putative DNA primase/helicase